MQEQQYRLQLQQSYAQQLGQLETYKGQLTQSTLAQQQEVANIGSNNEILSRWQAQSDVAQTQMMDEGLSNYRALASNLSSGENAMSATGRVGGSAARINASAKEQLSSFTGNSGKFSFDQGTFGSQYHQNALDLSAQKSNVKSAISMSQQAVGIYDETLASLRDTIKKQEAITADIGAKV